ncbi:MAG: DUF3301 domain-containing protein [Pseudomonadota bacterium]|nr:DUF3301 domain-containing protein [Pseudomonadota bacterium]
MTLTGLLIFIPVALLAVLWWKGMGSKEIARRAGARACREAQVQFLDDSVALHRLRVRRGPGGALALYRLYGFEFTSSGERRHNGYIHMLGHQLQKLEMEPYPE